MLSIRISSPWQKPVLKDRDYNQSSAVKSLSRTRSPTANDLRRPRGVFETQHFQRFVREIHTHCFKDGVLGMLFISLPETPRTARFPRQAAPAMHGWGRRQCRVALGTTHAYLPAERRNRTWDPPEPNGRVVSASEQKLTGRALSNPLASAWINRLGQG